MDVFFYIDLILNFKLAYYFRYQYISILEVKLFQIEKKLHLIILNYGFG